MCSRSWIRVAKRTVVGENGGEEVREVPGQTYGASGLSKMVPQAGSEQSSDEISVPLAACRS